jgi:hypothetical protein
LSKIVSAKIINAVLLATILVVGTIFTLVPSFMVVTVQAASEYGIDNNNKNNDYLKKIDCDNINTNLNGLNSDTAQDSTNNDLSGLTTGGIEDEDGISSDETVNAYSFGNKFDKDLVFCNNINSNEVAGSQGPNRINPLSIYTIVGESDSSFPDGTASSIAKCNLGDIAISGSYTIQRPLNSEFVTDTLTSSAGPDAHDSWQATATGPQTEVNAVSIQAIVNCLDNS